MSEKETKVTKQETLAALRNPGELYVIMSAATKMIDISTTQKL